MFATVPKGMYDVSFHGKLSVREGDGSYSAGGTRKAQLSIHILSTGGSSQTPLESKMLGEVTRNEGVASGSVRINLQVPSRIKVVLRVEESLAHHPSGLGENIWGNLTVREARLVVRPSH